MASLSAKCKKGTVIHRTTSETLRLGDEAALTINPQMRVTSRKKSQATSPSCSFQITGVMTRYDQEDESADDLDESHTDEISRVTDNETPSFSEDSRDDQQPNQLQSILNQNSASIAKHNSSAEENLPPPPTIREELNIRKTNNINEMRLGRFKVIKLNTVVPFSRGRWTCYDYLDDSSEIKDRLSNVRDSTTNERFWDSSCQPSYTYTGSTLLPEPLPIYIPLQNERPMPISSQTALPKSRVTFAICNNIDTVHNNIGLDTNQNEQNIEPPALNTSNQDLISNANDNEASVSSTATIDTKIEHALDVVKNHLTHAVRLEVEELKIKINELVERISFLEYENDLLRAKATPDVIANLGNIKANPN